MSKKAKLNQILRNIMKLLAARDKVLWESAEGWTSGSVTVPGVSEYETIHVVLENTTRIALHRETGGFLGGGVLATWSGGATVTAEFRFMVSGDRLTMVGESCYMLLHKYASGHDEKLKNVKITKIIGVEPIQSKILSGGGGS